MNWLETLTFDFTEAPISEQMAASADGYLSAQLTDEEIKSLTENYGYISNEDYSAWTIRDFKLPSDYLDLLRKSNGGEFTIGDRSIGFFSLREIREYYLNYEFPTYMPEALPFGLNGGGVFYAYDCREDSNSVIGVHASDLGWESAVVLGDNLEEVLFKNNEY